MEKQAASFTPPISDNFVDSTSSSGGQGLGVSNIAFGAVDSEGNSRQLKHLADIDALPEAKQPKKKRKVHMTNPGSVT